MHADSAMPETVAWDNAFPIFPTKRDRSKARSGTSSARGSGELPRPATSSSNRHERRSSKSRANSDSVNGVNGVHPARPIFEQKSYSYDQTVEQLGPPEALAPATSPLSRQTSPQYQVANMTDSPVQQDAQPQWSNPERQVSPPLIANQQQSIAQNVGLEQYHAEQVQHHYQNQPVMNPSSSISSLSVHPTHQAMQSTSGMPVELDTTSVASPSIQQAT